MVTTRNLISDVKQVIPTTEDICTFNRLIGYDWVTKLNASDQLTISGGMFWFINTNAYTAEAVYSARFPNGDKKTRESITSSMDIRLCIHVHKVVTGSLWWKKIGWMCNVSITFDSSALYVGSTVFSDLVSIVEFSDLINDDASNISNLVNGTDTALNYWVNSI